MFDSDGRPLNRVAPMIGPRLGSRILCYRKVVKVGVPPVEQDANLIDSEETKLLSLDDRMNRKYLTGLSSSLVFDSDGHPVDGGDVQPPRRRIDFSPFFNFFIVDLWGWATH